MSKLCPICKNHNKCDVSSGVCWCFNEKVPSLLISLVNQDEKNKSCICKNCVQDFKANKEEFLNKFKKSFL